MEKYKKMMELNRKQLMGEEIAASEKEDFVSLCKREVCSREKILRYKHSMKVNEVTDCMYPFFYLPPFNNNKKLRLVQGFLPKTHILNANHYELEILRLLVLFAPTDEMVNQMVDSTLKRLKKTCFGRFCPQGECKAAGISVLRFLAAVCPEDKVWIRSLTKPLGDLFLSFGAGLSASQLGIPMSYLLMAFTDINNEDTRALIEKKQEWLIGQRKGGKLSEGDTYHLLFQYIFRNAIGILPEKF